MTEKVSDFVRLCATKLLAVNVVLFVVITVALPYSGVGLAAISDSVTTIDANAIIKATNTARAVASLPSLAHSTVLDRAAQAKLDDMAARQYFAHVNPDGKLPWDWMTAQGYVFRAAGENLARGFTDPQAVVTAWMESPSHRANIVSTLYRDIGVASARVTMDGTSTLVVVQMMGTPRAGTIPGKTIPRATPKAAAKARTAVIQSQLPQAVSTDSSIEPVQGPTLIPMQAGSLTASMVSSVSSAFTIWLTVLAALLVASVAWVGMHRRLGWALVVHMALIILISTLPAVVSRQHLIF